MEGAPREDAKEAARTVSVTTSTNYLNWVNTEAVMYHARGDGRSRSVRVENAHCRALTVRYSQEIGVNFASGVKIWNIAVAQLDGIEPKDGDVIERLSDNTTWRVHGDNELLSDASRWRMATTEERQ